jgi:glycosyltransferase involved in cell wall biosynthesis
MPGGRVSDNHNGIALTLAERIPFHPPRCRGVIGAKYTPDQCRLCWLATFDPRYQRLWNIVDDNGPRDPLACSNRGGRVGIVSRAKAGCGVPHNSPAYLCTADGEQYAVRLPEGWLGVTMPVVKLPPAFVEWNGTPPAEWVTLRTCVNCPKRTLPPVEEGVRLRSPWAVAVTTAPRRQPRLARTLDTLAAAGWGPDCTTIYAEPGTDTPDGWPVERSPVQLGGWANWLRALRNTLATRPDAATIFMLQDDMDLSPDVRQLVEALSLPFDAGMLSPYCPSIYAPADGAPGPFRVIPTTMRGIRWFGMVGACTLMFPRHIAEELVRHPFVSSYNETRWIDGVVGHAVNALSRSTYFHWPSLAQHTGDTSTLHGSAQATGHRQAQLFVPELSATQLLPERPRTMPRVGIIGWCTASGLGRLNHVAARLLPAARWLAPRHSRFPYVEAPPGVELWTCNSTTNTEKLRAFMAGLDMVLCFELAYYPNVAEVAKSMNVKTVCVMMHECAPPGCKGFPQLFDMLIMPNDTCLSILAPALPRQNYRMIRWPIDVAEIPFKLRHRADSFYFGQGTGGGADRKGGYIVLEAAKRTPRIPWIVYSQIVDKRMRIFEVEYNYPPNVTVHGQVDNPADLYHHGDVAVQMSRYEGMGLQLLEAKAAGMPLITTDAGPMNEYDPFAVVQATPTRTRVVRPTIAWHADPVALAELVTRVHGADIAAASLRSRSWVEANCSWEKQGDAIRELFTDLCFPRR